jgi:4-diphosphocytidyl-2-C-methyl-D-erythritol kinase
MSLFRETAYAKINLALHVRKRRDDGYHELETLFAFVDQGDTLSLEPLDRLRLQCDGPFGALLSNGDDNLVLHAARLLAQVSATGAGAAITLTKNLPVASGIGGGSADAAAVVRLLNRHWHCGLSETEMEAMLAPLGADIPACVRSITVQGMGTGTALVPVSAMELQGLPVLLVNPGLPLATGPVFAAWDGIDRGPLSTGSALKAALSGRNDLEGPAISLCPPISALLQALQTHDPLLARMSGSGATCFALFSDPEKRDDAAMQMAKNHPGWWQLSGKLR